MQGYVPRYTGPRWIIIYGTGQETDNLVEKFAFEELYRKVQSFLPYVLGVYPVSDANLNLHDFHLILLGIRENNPWLSKIIQQTLPNEPQGYTIFCGASPWNPERRVIAITGADSSGLLYGVQDFISRILKAILAPEKPTPEKLRLALDSIGDQTIQEYPRITNRGIWTWGYVIYDFHRFFDNMARLKMNYLIIWNDIPPVNCREVIDYAHVRGIRVFLGFPWGWGMDLDITRPTDRQRIQEMVLSHYRQYYTGLGMDGLYFQTLTEHHHTELGGRSVAAIVCEMVNQIVNELSRLNPGLSILFGLHATSILDRYPELAPLDPRVTIVWEDAGVLPYTYIPLIQRTPSNELTSLHLDTFEETLEYSKKLATFRPDVEFAMVPKGWSALDWLAEFEHHGPYLLGVRDPAFIRERCRARQPFWDRINSLWMKYYKHAIQFYRTILACHPQKMTVAGLVEDGLFEERIQPSVALFAEMLWNPERNEDEILQLGMIPR